MAILRFNLIAVVYLASLSVYSHGWVTTLSLNGRRSSPSLSTLYSISTKLQAKHLRATLLFSTPSRGSSFGRQEYWEGFYKEHDADSFSWYAEWDDLEPLISEFISPESEILIPGVGIDSLVRDMYDAGYERLAAFDYAPESIVHCQNMLGSGRTVDLRTSDARDLPYASECFDAVIDKGTLDAVFLAGDNMAEKQDSLTRAISELDRVLRPGGIFWSLSNICIEPLQASAIWADSDRWEAMTDGSLYTTAGGYTSNNVDGTLLVWRKLK
jgi:SAM-dependent methyltransferase